MSFHTGKVGQNGQGNAGLGEQMVALDTLLLYIYRKENKQSYQKCERLGVERYTSTLVTPDLIRWFDYERNLSHLTPD
jgi:hypothetical protein